MVAGLKGAHKRTKKRYFFLLFLFIILTAAPAHASPLISQEAVSAIINVSSSSASYAITSNSFATAGIHTTSPVYEIYSSIQDFPALRLSSADFYSGIGFAKTAYFTVSSPGTLTIDPSSGFNVAPVHIKKITGTGFSEGCVVKLSSTTEIIATNVHIISSTELNCDLNIAGARAGFWDVVVTKEGEAGSVLSRGFEIKSRSFSSGTAVNSPNPFDPAREPTTIIYKLKKDTAVNVYLFSITGDLIWEDSFNAGHNGGKEGDNSVTWDGVSSFGEMLSNGVYLLHVVERSSGKTLAKGKIAILRR